MLCGHLHSVKGNVYLETKNIMNSSESSILFRGPTGRTYLFTGIARVISGKSIENVKVRYEKQGEIDHVCNEDSVRSL